MYLAEIEMEYHVSTGNEIGSMYRGVTRFGSMFQRVVQHVSRGSEIRQNAWWDNEMGMKVSFGHEMSSMHRELTRYGINFTCETHLLSICVSHVFHM